MKRIFIILFLLLFATAVFAMPPFPRGSDSMTYPGSGIAKSTGSGWDTSIGIGTLTNTKWCIYTTAAGIVCNSDTPAGGSVATDTIFDAAGDLVQGTGADASAKLTKGAAGTILRAGATSNAYSTSTFADTFVIGGILHAATANTIAALAPGAVGSFLMSNGSAAALSYLAAGAANQILVGAGVTTIPVWTSSSANMISLLGSADYSTARTNLGLAIGTNVQAYNSYLTAINQALTATSSPTFAAVTISKTASTAGQSVLYDDYSTELYGDGWMGSHQTGALGATRFYQFPTAVNTAGQAMVFGTPVGGISIGTWVTPALPNADTTGLTAANIPAPTTIVGSGSISVTTKNTYVICTSTCAVTLPVAAAGIQAYIRNAPGSATVITLVNRASQYYELTTHAAWATANQKLVSSGAATDSISVVGYDATHYATMNYTNAWTDTAP